jgi:hypothetical protein
MYTPDVFKSRSSLMDQRNLETFLSGRPRGLRLCLGSSLIMRLRVGPRKGKKATNVGFCLGVCSLSGELRERMMCHCNHSVWPSYREIQIILGDSPGLLRLAVILPRHYAAHGITIHKTTAWIFVAVKTSNLTLRLIFIFLTEHQAIKAYWVEV